MLGKVRRACAMGILVSLAACGGGGGGGNSGITVSDVGASAATPVPITFFPTEIIASTDVGVSASVSLTATLDLNVVTSAVYLVLQDEQSVFAGPVSINPTSNNTALVGIHTTTAAMAPGLHAGNIKVYLCKDINCNSQHPGSPVSLPYQVTFVATPPVITLNPTSLSFAAEVGVAAQHVVTGTVSNRVTGVPTFSADESTGMFTPTVSAVSAGGSNYQLTFGMSGNNLPGTYSGFVNLNVCNGPCGGGSYYPGSPVRIPYTMVITPPVMLQPTLTATGLPEWETYQGNAAHTGYVPTTLDFTRFSNRWSWNIGVPIHSVSTGDGKVFVSTPVYFAAASLYALNEADGSQSWVHNFGSVPALNPPAAYGGRVFIATSGHTDTFMWSFATSDGSLQFKTPFNAQWEHYLAPTVKDGEVYTNGGYYGGMNSFYASSGSNKWFASLGQYDQWTPAIEGPYAFGYTGYSFSAINRADGSLAFSVADSAFDWRGYSINAAPVATGNGGVLVVNGRPYNSNSVIRYSITARGESWRVNGHYVTDPVFALGTFYVSNSIGNRLEARNEATGTLLWNWVPPVGETLYAGNLILANNMVFVSTNLATYAVSLATHQTVWSVARTGHLAMSSNRVLYIVDPAGRIDAYNLF